MVGAALVLGLVAGQPGGRGVVGAALVLGLVAGGSPAAAALPAVVLYRMISLLAVGGRRLGGAGRYDVPGPAGRAGDLG